MIGPSTGPRIAVPPNAAVPIGCCDGGSRVAMMVIAVGISAPPVKPCPTRPAIIIGNVVEIPHTIEKPVKLTAAPRRKLRRPNRRTRKGLSGIMTISATR